MSLKCIFAKKIQKLHFVRKNRITPRTLGKNGKKDTAAYFVFIASYIMYGGEGGS